MSEKSRTFAEQFRRDKVRDIPEHLSPITRGAHVVRSYIARKCTNKYEQTCCETRTLNNTNQPSTLGNCGFNHFLFGGFKK